MYEYYTTLCQDEYPLLGWSTQAEILKFHEAFCAGCNAQLALTMAEEFRAIGDRCMFEAAAKMPDGGRNLNRLIDRTDQEKRQ